MDVDPRRVEAFRAGGFADEPGLSQRIHRNLDIGRLRVFVAGKDAIPQADFSWICVGTSGKRGHPDLRPIERAVRDIGALVARSRLRHTVLVRSTVPPGITRGRLWPLLKKAAGRASTRCGMVACPEFLREGAAVRDFVSASYHVIGAWDLKASAAAASLLRGLGGRILPLSAEEAELLKLAGNAFHAAKAAFANEIARLAASLNLDGEAILRALRRDGKLNASGAYLKPGMPFGGSCLPRDVRTLSRLARRVEVDAPLLNALAPSNRAHLESIRREILARRARSVGIAGLGFKPGVADLRESPAIGLARRLRRDGIRVQLFDRHADAGDPALRGLVNGGNWCPSAEELLRRSDAVVLTQPEAAVERAALRSKRPPALLRAYREPFRLHPRGPRK